MQAHYCSAITASTRGNWYRLFIEDDSCYSIYVSPAYTVLIELHKGYDCATMTCVSEQLYQSQGFKWKAKGNTTYHLFIAGVGSGPGNGKYSFAIAPYVSINVEYNIVYECYTMKPHILVCSRATANRTMWSANARFARMVDLLQMTMDIFPSLVCLVRKQRVCYA
jgi:hypothetical protein